MEPETTFERLLATHERMVLRTAYRLLGRLEDAQDASQEVFLRLHRHMDRIDLEQGITSWLYRTTVNYCFDTMRRRKPLDPIEFEPPVAGRQQEDLELAERRKLVAAALLDLPEKERAAIVLREIEGLETGEVARILGSSEGTVRSQVSVGKARLKDALARITRSVR